VYPKQQLARYNRIVSELRAMGLKPHINHIACTARAGVPETACSWCGWHRLYGLWPSRETMLSYQEHNGGFKLTPVLTWKTAWRKSSRLRPGPTWATVYVSYDKAFEDRRPAGGLQ